MLYEYAISTHKQDFYNITAQLTEAAAKSGVRSGMAFVYCPHTTAGITINENADPDVVDDMIMGLTNAYPYCAGFRHAEGNSAAHLKASAIGSSAAVIIENGRPVLGTWQGVYFCEFDPPRSRRFFVKVIGG